MRIIVCDMEVFSHDWLFVGRELTNTEHIVIVNSNDELKMLIEDEETIFCGFNMKNYDQFIIKSICLGLTPEDVMKVNDHIIDGGNGWEISIFNPRQFNFNYMDIMDDMQIGTSLKSIEGHLDHYGLTEEEYSSIKTFFGIESIEKAIQENKNTTREEILKNMNSDN